MTLGSRVRLTLVIDMSYSTGQKARFSGHNGDMERARFVERMRLSREKNGHPRGMLGKKHTAETREAIGAPKRGKKRPRERVVKMLKTTLEKYGATNLGNRKGSWQAGWHEIGGIKMYFRSSWEVKYANHLHGLKLGGTVLKWEYEPETIILGDSGYAYKPDFRVTLPDASQEYHEVKGWMDDRSKTKLQLMASLFPDKKVVVIDKNWFKEHDNAAKNQGLPA